MWEEEVLSRRPYWQYSEGRRLPAHRRTALGPSNDTQALTQALRLSQYALFKGMTLHSLAPVCVEYLATLRTFPGNFSPQLAHPYRTKVLRAMETVLSSHIHELDKDTAGIVILLASSEMTKTKVRASGHVDWGGQLLFFGLHPIVSGTRLEFDSRDPLILCTPQGQRHRLKQRTSHQNF